MENSKAMVNQKMTLRTDNDDSISVVVREIKIDAGQQHPEVWMKLTVDPDAYEKIDLNCLFGLQPENRGQILGGEFDAGKEFEINLRLKKANLKVVIDSLQNAEMLREALLDAGHEPYSQILRAADSWLATTVTQNMELPPHLQGKGSVKFGYSTKWASVTENEADANANATGLTALLIQFFETHQLKFAKQKDRDVYRIRIAYLGEELDCLIHVFESEQQIMVLALYPKDIAESDRPLISEFVTRANYGLVNGNFALNLDNGDLHFKLTGQFSEPEYFDEKLGLLMRESVQTLAKYAPGVMKLLDEKVGVAEIIGIIERG